MHDELLFLDAPTRTACDAHHRHALREAARDCINRGQLADAVGGDKHAEASCTRVTVSSIPSFQLVGAAVPYCIGARLDGVAQRKAVVARHTNERQGLVRPRQPLGGVAQALHQQLRHRGERCSCHARRAEKCRQHGMARCTKLGSPIPRPWTSSQPRPAVSHRSVVRRRRGARLALLLRLHPPVLGPQRSQ